MKNLSGLMKQAQKLQSKMAEMQAEVGNRTVTAQAGGGMVEARAVEQKQDSATETHGNHGMFG